MRERRSEGFLDLPVTLEYLETLGVPVLGWETNEFPAFYLRQSGLEIPRVDSVEEVASILKLLAVLDIRTGFFSTHQYLLKLSLTLK